MLREEALGDGAVQIEIQPEHREQDYQHRERVFERCGQRAPVKAEHRFEKAFGSTV